MGWYGSCVGLSRLVKSGVGRVRRMAVFKVLSDAGSSQETSIVGRSLKGVQC